MFMLNALLPAVREHLASGVRELLASAPTGGTERERQAWLNGVREACEAISGESPDFMHAAGFPDWKPEDANVDNWEEPV